MILTITLNPAWDVTYQVEALTPGHSHRVLQVAGQAGGKGVNVSRVLAARGVATTATGVVGGATGRAATAELRAAGVAGAWLDADLETRTTVAVVTPDGAATLFNEPGPAAGGPVRQALLRHLEPLVAQADLVVLAGSLPPWAPVDAYLQITELAAAAGRPVVVDAGGAALTAALPARPELVKPNRAELAEATGTADLRAGARALLAAGARRVVVTDGAQGMYGFAEGTGWHALPPRLDAVNPTGAGDAALAALAVGLGARDDWPEMLRRAVAWSAAAVLDVRAGHLRADRLAELSAAVRVVPAEPATPRSGRC